LTDTLNKHPTAAALASAAAATGSAMNAYKAGKMLLKQPKLEEDINRLEGEESKIRRRRDDAVKRRDQIETRLMRTSTPSTERLLEDADKLEAERIGRNNDLGKLRKDRDKFKRGSEDWTLLDNRVQNCKSKIGNCEREIKRLSDQKFQSVQNKPEYRLANLEVLQFQNSLNDKKDEIKAKKQQIEQAKVDATQSGIGALGSGLGAIFLGGKYLDNTEKQKQSELSKNLGA
jgi:predicted RNase H-like nuclease (RuvC/YqgF family)